MSDAETLFRQGVQAVRGKNRAEGKRLLTQALRLDPQNDEAWVWLARTVDEPEKQLQCAERALKINPDNTDAIALQDQILLGKPSKPQPSAPRRDVPVTAPAAKPQPSPKEQTLGMELGTFSANPSWYILRIGIGLVVFVFASIYLWSQLKDAPSITLDESALGLAVAGVVELVSFLWLLGLFGGLLRRVSVYENGLRVDNLLVLRSTYLWSDITGFTAHNRITKYAAGGTYNKHEYRVFAKGSQVLYINDGTQDVRTLGNLLTDKTTPAIAQQLVDRYNSGETLKFERGIKVSKEGFKYKNDTYAWKDIRDFELKNGNIFVYRNQNPHFGIRVHTFGMQNTLALFRLLALILHQR